MRLSQSGRVSQEMVSNPGHLLDVQTNHKKLSNWYLTSVETRPVHVKEANFSVWQKPIHWLAKQWAPCIWSMVGVLHKAEEGTFLVRFELLLSFWIYSKNRNPSFWLPWFFYKRIRKWRNQAVLSADRYGGLANEYRLNSKTNTLTGTRKKGHMMVLLYELGRDNSLLITHWFYPRVYL